ncbi:hypothetical protein OE766_14495 [Pararhizobium sp. YC-54]|uniref:hypothetical protein n=1 Tax=Pararhizobium sp. YC-54 TaxID=2986920 RepID=UPI0021F7820B|nr:hypothetical protein [Pararhizobium sp. YC-54]MCV9999452.1 hypothetical protein [Pararhizobium sp. YC-54]
MTQTISRYLVERHSSVGLDHCLEMVIAFQTAFSNPISSNPRKLAADRLSTRVEYLLSEVRELEAADSIEAQSDALADLIYFALGAFAEMGIKPQRVFEIVHSANMSKRFPDGSVRHLPINGKVAKPAEWVGPEDAILEEIKRQTNKSIDRA